jgi:hypothetical protein
MIECSEYLAAERLALIELHFQLDFSLHSNDD